MKNICVLHHNRWFEEFYQEIASWRDVIVVDPQSVDYKESDNADVHYHIWGQVEWFSTADRMPSQRACRMTLRYVEQISLGDTAGMLPFQQLLFQQFLAIAHRFDKVFVSSRASEQQLRRTLPNIAGSIFQMPIGYTRHLGTPDFGCQQDIDILLYGTPTPRRKEVIQWILQRLSDLHVVALAGVWGEQRNEMIRRAKILLHIQNVPGLFPSMRMWRALANGAFWISEEIGDPFPVLANEHFIEVETITPQNVDAVCATLRSWTQRDADRNAIRICGHEAVKQMPMRLYFDEICRRVDAIRS